MSKEIVTYNDHIYQKLEVEETEPNSGRYKVLSRTSLTVHGVLDDEATYNEAEDMINKFTFTPRNNSMVMVLHGPEFYKIFSTVTLHTANYKTRFEAILEAINEIGFCRLPPFERDGKIQFDIETWAGEKQTLYLEGYTDKVIVIGE